MPTLHFWQKHVSSRCLNSSLDLSAVPSSMIQGDCSKQEGNRRQGQNPPSRTYADFIGSLSGSASACIADLGCFLTWWNLCQNWSLGAHFPSCRFSETISGLMLIPFFSDQHVAHDTKLHHRLKCRICSQWKEVLSRSSWLFLWYLIEGGASQLANFHQIRFQNI